MAERETFYEAQRRHRRSGWRFSVLSAVAVALLGLPLSVVVSPFGAAVGLMALDVASLAVPTPDPAADIGRFVERLSEADDEVDADLDGVPDEREPVSIPAREAATVAVALVVPGMLLMALTWFFVRRVVLRGGAGAVVLASGARPPRPGDLEEGQLVNLVEEMALAAGVPPPRVMILDSEAANAAVVGRSIDDATIVVSRRILDDLGRAPTGALVGDLLAVVVNGDLRIALVLSSVFQTCDLVGALLSAPFSRRTRQVLWRLIRRRGNDVDLIVGELAVVGRLGHDDDNPSEGCVTTMLKFPWIVASLAYSVTWLIVGGLFVVPVLAALWRRRRLLADATAVELTRDPDALVAALRYLQDNGAPVASGPWTHLFMVGREVAQERTQRVFEQRRNAIWTDERQPGESRFAAASRRAKASIAASSDYQRETTPNPGVDDDGSSDLATFLPPVGKRIERLEAMGAQLRADPDAAPRKLKLSLLGLVAAWVVGLLLGAIMLVLLLAILALVAALIYLALLFEMALVAVPVAIVHALTR